MHLVQEIGSYAGFAAVVGLAVLSALYFSQARDVKRLRDWAGRAPERAAEQEARIASQAQEQRTAAAAGAAVAGPAARPQPAPPVGGPTPPPTLPASRPTAAYSTSVLGDVGPDERWYRRIHWPAPRYIVLIVVGILVIGAGAAYGVSHLSGGSDSSASAPPHAGGSGGGSSSPSKPTTHKLAAVDPHSITVAVLNGTTVTGLANTVANEIQQAGFQRGNTDNALTQGQQAESVVEYSGDHRRAARLVGQKLGISQVEKIDAQTQGIAGDATVTVIVGADKAGSTG
jgi:LytR cell envelope-related transcriptional attenuator